MHGFQLWANLPSSLKMTAPRYQDVKAAAIPEVTDDDGTRVRGGRAAVSGVRGVPWTALPPSRIYLDVFVPPGRRQQPPG